MITFVYPWILMIGIPAILGALWWRSIWYKSACYMYPPIAICRLEKTWKFRWAFFTKLLRMSALFLLIIATSRPRIPNEQSRRYVEGVATMMVIDVSGSMNCFDDVSDTSATRFSVAKREAIAFMKRRPYDLFGIVLFGATALSRCPLTADNEVATAIIRDTEIGLINPDGTALGLAVAMGVQRLKDAASPSKIMILLTDGEPSPGDLDSGAAINLAQKAGIKIYTIGIGQEAGGYIQHPWAGIVQVPTPLNVVLLEQIAKKTGGLFFRASNRHELETIYAAIDKLEVSRHEAPYYAEYVELGMIFVLLAVMILIIEIILTMYIRVVL